MGDVIISGKIERGKVISADTGLYTVVSFDREGIQVAGIPSADGSSYAVGDVVHFVSFPDGTGWVACGQDGKMPMSGYLLETVRELSEKVEELTEEVERLGRVTE